LDLVDRTTIVEDPALNAGYPDGTPNDITITFADGEQVRKRVDFPRGHYRNPMSDDEVVAKFHRLARGVIPDATADRILSLAWRTDELTDLRDLLEFDVL
jgi:2-methylcitrate dehydratase